MYVCMDTESDKESSIIIFDYTLKAALNFATVKIVSGAIKLN